MQGLCLQGTCQKVLPPTTGCVAGWESSGSLSQLKGEECAGERDLQSMAHGRGRRMLHLGFSREAAKGLCSPVTRCPVAASSSRLLREGAGLAARHGCEPGPHWSRGLSKGRSCSRTGNPVAGSPGWNGAGSVPTLHWLEAIWFSLTKTI